MENDYETLITSQFCTYTVVREKFHGMLLGVGVFLAHFVLLLMQ